MFAQVDQLERLFIALDLDSRHFDNLAVKHREQIYRWLERVREIKQADIRKHYKPVFPLESAEDFVSPHFEVAGADGVCEVVQLHVFLNAFGHFFRQLVVYFDLHLFERDYFGRLGLGYFVGDEDANAFCARN